MFKEQYFDSEHEVMMEFDLIQFKQKDEAIGAFLIEFENKAGYLNTPMTEKKLVSIARRNVREEYRQALALIEIEDFSHLKRLCKKFVASDDSRSKIEKPDKSEVNTKRNAPPHRWVEKRVNEIQAKVETDKPGEGESDSSIENPYEVFYMESKQTTPKAR